MIEAVTEFSFVDIFTHFDYRLRFNDVLVKGLKKPNQFGSIIHGVDESI